MSLIASPGPIFPTGGLYVNGNYTINSSLIVGGNAHFNGNLVVNNHTRFNGDMIVSGNLTIVNNATVTVSGISTIGGASIGRAITTTDSITNVPHVTTTPLICMQKAEPTNHRNNKLLRNVKTRQVDDVCGICLNCSTDTQWQRPRSCKHVFHRICIRSWIQECEVSYRGDIHCPMCRRSMINLP